jgi:hypothetical protein
VEDPGRPNLKECSEALDIVTLLASARLGLISVSSLEPLVFIFDDLAGIDREVIITDRLQVTPIAVLPTSQNRRS